MFVVFEILFFAFISFILINKLFSMLGEVEDDSGGKVFNMKGSVIDVTDSSVMDIKEMSLVRSDLVKDLIKAKSLISDFKVEDFLNKAEMVLGMLIDSAAKKVDKKVIEELVDKRYLESFYTDIEQFKDCNVTNVSKEIDEISIFGNNVLMKVKFNLKDMDISCTFSKSAIVEGPIWYLVNIQK